jgi:tRNA threonylcarbamoyladenosine biosynthesis protein TsaE
VRALGYQGAVKSPTYTLVEPYTVGGLQVFHVDLYRLSDPEELEYVGLQDFLDGHTVLLVEWPERGLGMLPAEDLDIEVVYVATGRLCRLRSVSATGEAVLRVLVRD